MENEFQEIENLLKAQDLDKLIGRAESIVFEAKGPSPYDFSKKSGHWELAKDVASFANIDGGFIIIGLDNNRLPGEDIDRVGAISLIEKSAFNDSQYFGIVREYIHGKISGLQVRWVEHKDKPGRGVGVIQIPPQSDNSKPFLLYQPMDEDKNPRCIVFGIASRKGAHSIPQDAEGLRKALSKGIHDTAVRLTRIEVQLANMQDQFLALDGNLQILAAKQQPLPVTPSPDPFDSRIERTLEDE